MSWAGFFVFVFLFVYWVVVVVLVCCCCCFLFVCLLLLFVVVLFLVGGGDQVVWEEGHGGLFSVVLEGLSLSYFIFYFCCCWLVVLLVSLFVCLLCFCKWRIEYPHWPKYYFLSRMPKPDLCDMCASYCTLCGRWEGQTVHVDSVRTVNAWRQWISDVSECMTYI